MFLAGTNTTFYNWYMSHHLKTVQVTPITQNVTHTGTYTPPYSTPQNNSY